MHEQRCFVVLESMAQPGHENDFKVLMNEMVTSTHAHEPGALNYEWSVSADGSECHIFERYADSDAVMTHLTTFKEKFAGRFLELLKPVRSLVYGSPSQKVKDTLSGFNPTYMQPVGGFSRLGEVPPSARLLPRHAAVIA